MNTPPNFKTPPSFGALPLPIFSPAVNQANNNLQTPPGMGLKVALAAAALTTQGLADVRMPTGQQIATSLMIAILANSGERKTAMETIFFKIMRQMEELNRLRYESEYSVYKRTHEVWRVTGNVKKKQLKKKLESGDGAEKEAEELKRHLEAEPVPPVLFRVLFEDSTLPALFQSLRVLPTAGLISSEGGGILGGPIFAEQTKLNAMWSGSPVPIDRVSTESFVLAGVRLTVLVMVQPGMLREFLADKGEKARASGLLARMLFCNTGTTQGTRLIQNTTVSWDHCDRFNDRIKELMERNIAALKDPNFKRQVIRFSPEAESAWLQFYNVVESHIQPNGFYAKAGDHASKLAENVARVAAVLHFFEGFEGDISLDTLNAAILIVRTSSSDFADIFITPPEFHEATILDDWLTQKYRNFRQRYVSKSVVRKYCPNSLRNTALLDHILGMLVQSGKVAFVRNNKTLFLDLFPGYGSV